MDLNLNNLPAPESLNAFWDSEDGQDLKNKWFTVTKVRKYFRKFKALGAADIDGWRGREHARYLLMNNDAELHQLILDELTFPYIMGKFVAQFLPEIAEGLLFAFLKKNGGLRPLLCGSLWRRCAARLVCDCTRDAAHKYFTTTYPNFINAQVAFMTVPHVARSCLTCSMMCPMKRLLQRLGAVIAQRGIAADALGRCVLRPWHLESLGTLVKRQAA